MTSDLRAAFGSLAKSADIDALRSDITDKFDQRARDAHNSIPSKVGMVFGAGMFLLALISLMVNLKIHG